MLVYFAVCLHIPSPFRAEGFRRTIWQCSEILKKRRWNIQRTKVEYSKKKGGRDEEQRNTLEGKPTYLYLYNRLLPYSDVLGCLCSSVLTTRRIRIIGFADVVTRSCRLLADLHCKRWEGQRMCRTTQTRQSTWSSSYRICMTYPRGIAAVSIIVIGRQPLWWGRSQLQLVSYSGKQRLWRRSSII